MAKNKVSEWSSTPANNTDVGGIDIAEGCAPSGINNAIREVMAQIKDMQAGTDDDNLTVGGNLAVTGTSAFTGAITATGGVVGNVTGNASTATTATNATSATAATKATNIAGGGAGQVPYNSGADTTAFLAAGTSGQFLQSNGTSAPSWGDVRALTSGTSQASTSGTSIDFTSIPSWAKRITVMFNGVSTNGSSSYLVQLGTSSGVENTGYTGSGSAAANGLAAGVASSTSGFYIFVNTAAAVTQVTMIITNVSGNSWISGHFGSRSDSAVVMTGGGAKTTASTLDRIRITTVNGTDTFDAGSINIIYE